MIYYVNENEKLSICDSKQLNNMETAFQKKEDIRNYAITICYQDGKLEQILRSNSISFHYNLFKMLRDTSSKFFPYTTLESVEEVYHTTIDTNLSKNNHLVLYSSEPTLVNKDLFASICLPSDKLNDYQRSFLREKEIYLLAYSRLVYYKYNIERGCLEDLFDKHDRCGHQRLSRILGGFDDLL